MVVDSGVTAMNKTMEWAICRRKAEVGEEEGLCSGGGPGRWLGRASPTRGKIPHGPHDWAPKWTFASVLRGLMAPQANPC